jgi:hypothetical protein
VCESTGANVEELNDAIEQGTAMVAESDGGIQAYASAIAFFRHAVGESNQGLQALIAAAKEFGVPGILVPSRNAGLFRWCLESGLRVVQPMTLMTVGALQRTRWRVLAVYSVLVQRFERLWKVARVVQVVSIRSAVLAGRAPCGENVR